MSYPSIFDVATLAQNKKRLDKLTQQTKPLWGVIDSAQMLAHLNVAYQVTQGKVKVRLNPIVRLFLKVFIKKTVVGNKPFSKNSKSAPYFLIANERDFEEERELLLQNMQWVFEKGAAYFNDRPTGSFGKLKTEEWSNLFQKHLDHHFKQFGV